MMFTYIAIEVINVEVNAKIISITTSTFKGWTPPYASINLPLASLRELPVGDTFSIIVDVARNLSNILPAFLKLVFPSFYV